MAKKDNELGLTGAGVETLEIPELEKAIAKYQRKKEARCAASPDEVVAKKEVRALLHQFRDKLPVTAEGVPFYRCDDRDYLLDEKLVIHKVDKDSDTGDDDE